MDIDKDFVVSLRDYLFKKTSKSYFGKIKVTPKDVMVSCPFHKDGQENKPSCGIKRFSDDGSVAGQVHCFTCGEHTTISGMLYKILGAMYDPIEIESLFHLQQLSVETIFDEKPKPLFSLPSKSDYVSEDILRRFRGVYHPYLARRGISKTTADMYDIGFESENQHITFPIKDVNNKCVGVGRRSIIGKNYYYPQGMVKPLYGIYELSFPINYLWIVEGPFNLWSLAEWGKKGVALLGTGTKYQYDQLKDIDVDGYVLALDPDSAGRNGTVKLIDYLLDIGRSKIYVCDLPNGRDINDLTREEFSNCECLKYYEWENKYKNYL